MKHLIKFEKFDPNNQSLEITADMNTFNNAENNIKDFNTKKGQFEKIYSTYIDKDSNNEGIPDDLYNKLVQGNFIKPNSNRSKIEFINPLFGLYSEVCKKQREFNINNNTLTQKKNELAEKQKSLNNGQGDSETLKNDILNITNDIQAKTKSLGDINIEIGKLKKAAMDDLNTKIKSLADSKKRITTLNQHK